MPEVTGHNCSVVWYTPYKDPPNGMDRVQLTVFRKSTRGIPPEILKKLEELGEGWTVSWGSVHGEQRTLSLNQKRRLRRTKLWNRLQRQAPLFADQFYDEKIATKPEYYGCTGMKPPYPRPPTMRR